MNEYYLCISDQWFGPMSIDKLREYPVSKDMLIWWPGLNEWKRVGELSDLEHFFQTVPPPLKTVDKTVEASENNKRIVVRDIDDLVYSYHGMSSFLFYTSVLIVLIGFMILICYSVVLLVHNPKDVYLFYGSLFGLFVVALVIYFMSVSFRKKSVILRDKLSRLRLGSIQELNVFSVIYTDKDKDI
jgi:hypothetical protein